MRPSFIRLTALLLLLLAPVTGVAQQKSPFATFQEALASGGALAGQAGPRNVNWIDGGRRFSFTTRGASGEEIRAMDPVTGRDTLLFSAAGLTFPGTAEPFAYRSFQWAQDSRNLVFQTRFQGLYRNSGTADYYVYSLADRAMQLAAEGARTAELSPDGGMLGYERGGDLFVFDMARHQETRLTSGATETVYNGHFDWAYEEEFGFAQAWAWSPDSRYIAFWQVDESREPVIQISDLSGHHPTWDRIRIPQPGDTNATVRIGVAGVRGGAPVWLDPGATGEYYIPRIYWTSRPDTLAVMTLNRRQNTMTLYFFDVRTGGKRQVMSETSSTWVDVYDFFAGVRDLMSFPEGTTNFFWISGRDGWSHIYRYDYSGRLVNQVTRGNWSVTRIEGTDARGQTLYYSSTEASPLQRQLYAIRFDGSAARRLTTTQGTHAIDMSPDTRFFIDRWSSTTHPRQVDLWTTSAGTARLLRTMEDNAAVTTWLATHVYSPLELFSFTTEDGAHIDASMIRPSDFDSTRQYPVLFAIYGGPGSQGVYDAWGSSTWSQWLAQEGYVVVNVNNRGNNNYGTAFLKAAYRRVGYWEANDFAQTARYLMRNRWVDSTRIGIMGTSHGGYATLMTMARYPTIFSVGISNSPTTDFRLYDTIWSERYLGLADDDGGAAYDSSSVLLRAGLIRGKLLLVHSLMDDNVHPTHTFQMLTALTNAGVDADVRIYPPGGHGAAYSGQSRTLMLRVYNEYLNTWLRRSATRMPGSAATH